jgi:hypothetical protein
MLTRYEYPIRRGGQILTIEALMAETERPRFPDLTLGRSTFKRPAVEDIAAEQGKFF